MEEHRGNEAPVLTSANEVINFGTALHEPACTKRLEEEDDDGDCNEDITC